MLSNQFDYVVYDETAQNCQQLFKEKFIQLHDLVAYLPNGRARALVLTKLEEAYMWVGKAIRDDQIARNGSAPLQP